MVRLCVSFDYAPPVCPHPSDVSHTALSRQLSIGQQPAEQGHQPESEARNIPSGAAIEAAAAAAAGSVITAAAAADTEATPGAMSWLANDEGLGSSSDPPCHAEHAVPKLNAAAAHHMMASSCDRAYLSVIWGPAPICEQQEGQVQMPARSAATSGGARAMKDALGHSTALYGATNGCHSLWQHDNLLLIRSDSVI